MRTLSYYPGCSMKAGSKFYEASLKKVLPVYGIALKEVDDWSCCGASAAHTVSEMAGYALAARNIAAAEPDGLDLVAPCSACYSRSKIVNEKMREDRVLQEKINEVIEPLKWTGSIEVKNIVEIFSDYVGLAEIARKNKYDLSALKIAPYYGCVLTRLTRVKPFDDRENPESMDDLLGALGAGLINWPYKMECCGASKTITHQETTRRLSDKIMDMAINRGANVIVTPCPLCQMNLDLLPSLGRTAPSLPVLFLSEVFELALFGRLAGRGSHMIATDTVLSRVKEAA